MSAVISWMAAEGERPVEMDIPPFDLASPDGEATPRAGSCRKEGDKGGETADSSQESVGMESFPPNENRPSTSLRAGSGWGSPSAPAQFTEALTDNYIKLRLRGRHEANRWLRARVEEVAEGVLMGEALEF